MKSPSIDESLESYEGKTPNGDDCRHNNCRQKAIYGTVNSQTGMFEKIHCIDHKQNGEKGRAPPWNKRFSDFIKICKNRGYTLVTTENEWKIETKEKGKEFKPKMKCKKEHTVKNTTIHHFINSNSGCPECSGQLPWSERYQKFVDKCKERGYKLLITLKEWEEGTTEKGGKFKPKMSCDKEHLVYNTKIDSFVNGNGCIICANLLPWSDRFQEFIDKCKERGYKLLTTLKEWEEGTKKEGCKFKPKMECDKQHPVNNTMIGDFVNSNRGCPECVNKTEGIFHKYTDKNKDILKIKSIKIHFKPEWANLKQTLGTYYEYDFIIELTNGIKIIVEIDGPQHYKQISNWNSVLYTQIRDKIKEKLAIKQRINIIRLNQEDIYNNKNDWNKKFENYINRKFECKDRIDVTDYADGKRYIKDGQ